MVMQETAASLHFGRTQVTADESRRINAALNKADEVFADLEGIIESALARRKESAESTLRRVEQDAVR